MPPEEHKFTTPRVVYIGPGALRAALETQQPALRKPLVAEHISEVLSVQRPQLPEAIPA